MERIFMDVQNSFLRASDFPQSPLLGKIYELMRPHASYDGTIAPPVLHIVDPTLVLTPTELNTVITTLRRCDPSFNEDFARGGEMSWTINNTGTRLVQTPTYSTTRQVTNWFANTFSSSESLKTGEIYALQLTLFRYALNIMTISDEEALALGRQPTITTSDGRNIRNPSFNIRPKEDQKRVMNKLFCNMGERLATRETREATLLEENAGRKVGNPNVSLPKGSISSFLKGGRKRKTRRRRAKK